MAKNRDAIVEWVHKNRPDCLESMITLTDDLRCEAVWVAMTFAFDAGRQYQSSMDTPSEYDWMSTADEYL